MNDNSFYVDTLLERVFDKIRIKLLLAEAEGRWKRKHGQFIDNGIEEALGKLTNKLADMAVQELIEGK